jgi:uncharacterized membrane protein
VGHKKAWQPIHLWIAAFLISDISFALVLQPLPPKGRTDETVDVKVAQTPEGWDINFKPAYETKFISSIRLKANQSRNIAVEVKPAPNSPAGEYPLNLRVSSGDAKTEASLTVIDLIEPNGLKQVEMIITPYEEPLVGDYSVGVKVEGEKASKTLELRTSVKDSGAWGRQEIRSL